MALESFTAIGVVKTMGYGTLHVGSRLWAGILLPTQGHQAGGYGQAPALTRAQPLDPSDEQSSGSVHGL